ncbi:biliverdin-producing heme oxygenase [Pseudomonas lopnurensis]|uniref:biliverdin-producing heme oxygenase n=1 Tax=Pseudomonas lopnurensis TaxID=1477517 RepID=UPI00187A2792|nr:biliverdin-producing heme oxygenase [Pseudomonas lopnurensis]MBE7374240.1 biliverdin-producing heme oxygenase [Pseudomonas lopnurensis]
MSASSHLSHPLRSQRLNTLTHEPHERLEALVKAHEPFASRENFARFVTAQYLFQYDLQTLYRDPRLMALVEDLPSRCRVEAARLDLADFGVPVPAGDEAIRSREMCVGEALAWLFVSEGSKLGAEFLFQKAAALRLDEGFGARHLAAPKGGRAQGWKGFVKALDGVELDSEQERRADAAAIEAFERFAVHLERCFA